jgi:heterodisulfide reductase subunit B
MTAYGYYPGCSLEKNASAYHDSTMAVSQALSFQLDELHDWNCCGATEYIAVEKIPAYALVSRNLAIASQRETNGTGNQLVAPCSACFLNLSKADEYLGRSPEMTGKVNTCLAEADLSYEPGSVRVRHLLDVVVNDIGYEQVEKRVKRPLYDLRIAPYYGCLIVRPGYSGEFDDFEYPQTLDKLLRALGAEVVDYPVKAHCCGGHMTQISEKVALTLIHRLLKSAADYEADMIATLCPMCQLNLDAYQEAVNREFGANYQIPIMYFTQLMGLAFDMPSDSLGFGKEFVDAEPTLTKIGVEPPSKPRQKRPSKDALPMPQMPEEE